MTGLPDDMGRLCGEIRDLHSGNAAFLNDLKAAVSGIKSEVSQMENGFRQSREEVAEKTRRDLKASTEDVRNFVSDLKSEASRLQDDFRSSFNTMARTGRSERGAFVADLRSDMSRMRNAFLHSRKEMGEQTRRDLKASTEEVRNFVSDLKSEASRLQDDFRSSFNTMARTGRSERGAFVADLRNSVGRLREEVISDLSAVRRMWSNPSPVQPVKKKQAEEEKSQEMSPDDLTKIPGIGSGIAMRLNQAGISTYAQLARSTHDQLRVALGKFAQLDDTYDWRGEARKFI
jgi:uncharacterized protein YukE